MILHYDLETTGFTSKHVPLSHVTQPRIVQLAAILDHPDGTEAMRVDLIVAHNEALPENIMVSWKQAEKIHGISPELSRKIGINETTAIELFLDMLQVAELVSGQNIKKFDNAIITGTARRVVRNEAFDPFAGKNIFDTMLAGQILCRIPFRGGEFKKPNLGELHRVLFNEDFLGAHRAINDVLAARRCFYEMQRRTNPTTN